MVEEMEGREGAGLHQTGVEAGHQLVCRMDYEYVCEASRHACHVFHTFFC